MELDLDSLLRAHGGHLSSSDDDLDGDAFLHRTVDEILNDSDSSDDSSPPPPTSIINPNQQQEEAQTLEKEKEDEFSFTSRRSRSSSSSAASLSSLGFRSPNVAASTPSSSSSRPLPLLFGGVRPNLKPGAALAAATAASRSIPTPHAAAIKNRRAGSSGSIRKVESSGDLQEIRELSDVITDGKRLEISAEIYRSSSSSLSSAEAEEATAMEVVKDEATEGSKDDGFGEETEKSISEEAKENNLEEDLVDSNLFIASSSVSDKNAQQLDDSLPIQDSVVSIADSMDGIVSQELVTPELPNDELSDDSDKKASDDGELDRVIGEGGDVEEEIDKTVEERLEQLEKAEKKAEKPLEQAEELEKRYASYGLHWEEGAAAQPMRLEGIRRGPPAVGYLQLDLDNTVTRAVSSQTFKRDYGFPQVVAVHMNFIAIGTLRGAVLVFPSKYSAHSPDHMDSKVSIFLGLYY